MNTYTGIGAGVIAVVVIVGVAYASMSSTREVAMDKPMDNPGVMQKADAVKEGEMADKAAGAVVDSPVVAGEPMKKDETKMIDKPVETSGTMMKGSYESYAPEKLARAGSGDVVLFFHASWCPSCRGLNADIEAHLSTIPEGVSILKADYDKETALKVKYGVTYQHTLVQVDAQGNLIKKWSGSPKLSNLLSQIQ